MHRWCAVLALLMTCSAGAKDIRVPLPADDLVLAIPDDWTAQVRPTLPGQPHAATISGPSREALMLLFSPIGPVRPDAPRPTAERVRAMVERAAAAVKSSAEESELTIRDLEIPGAVACYFSATDRQPRPGEYKHLSQGAIGIDEYLVTFTVLMNGNADELRSQALAALRSLRRQAR